MLCTSRGGPFSRDVLVGDETDTTNPYRALHGYRRRCSKEYEHVLVHTTEGLLR